MKRRIISAAAILVCAQSAYAGTTWDGGGGNGSWNVPANWTGDTVPPANSFITIAPSAQPVMTQNLSGQYEATGMQINGGTSISGNPIQFINATITSSLSTAFTFNNNVQLGGASANTIRPTAALSFGNIVFSSLTGGAGGMIVQGDTSLGLGGGRVIVGSASYTGPTTVEGKAVLVVNGTTSGQGDYSVLGALAGNGNINLAAGKKVSVSGNISPGDAGLPFNPGTMNITGDLVFNTNGRYFFDGSPTVPDRVNVSGLVDMSAANDTFFDFTHPNPGSYIVATYGNRLGQFDNVNIAAGAQLIYTSAENSGPGQVVLLVPEPACAAASLIALAALTHPAVRRPR